MRIDRTGQRYGSLTVQNQEPTVFEHPGHTLWKCRCDCSATIIVRSDHLSLGYTSSCGDRSIHVPAGRNQTQGYNATHKKVRSVLGSAREHGCSRDECESWATEWAYDHLDVEERRTPGGHTYSTNPEHYIPMCRLHHAQFDARHRQNMAEITRIVQVEHGPVPVLDHPAFVALRRAVMGAEA